MLRTLVWYLFFWMYMILSIPLAILLFILYLPGLRKVRNLYLKIQVNTWAKAIIFLAGVRVKIIGKENIPKEKAVCFVANHQGGFDIPLLLRSLPRTVGFIAKKELSYIPILNIWMIAIGCVFIDRKNKKKSRQAIMRGAQLLKNRKAMVIFPEGTRSQSAKTGNFKSGSLKMAIRSKVPIVPVTIDGSYKIKEANGGIMKPADVRIIFHPPVETEKFTDKETSILSEKLRKVITKPLK